MTKHMLGTYQTEEAAINAIAVYELGGHQSKNIVIFTNEENAKSLKERTSAIVKTDTPTPEEDTRTGIFKKLKGAFEHKADFELDTSGKLVDFGLPLEEAEKSLADVKAGKIVVLVDDELRMGHA